MAFATDGHVFISSSEEALVFFIGGTEGEAGALFAQLADGGQLLDFLAFGDELYDRLERPSQESTAQGADDHDLAIVGAFLGKLDYVGEELALVNANHIIVLPDVAKVAKFEHGGGSSLLALMGNDLTLLTVTLIG